MRATTIVLTLIAAVCLVVLTGTRASAVQVFSEDFNYGLAELTPITVVDPANTNGWTVPAPFSYADTDNVTQAVTPSEGMTLINSILPNQQARGSHAGIDHAAVASVSGTPDNGTVSVTYDYRYRTTFSPDNAGMVLRSTGGDQVELIFDPGSLGFVLGINQVKKELFAQLAGPDGSNFITTAVTTFLDLEADTVSVSVLANAAIYGGSNAAATSTYALPAGFDVDEILIFSEGYQGAYDNISIDHTPIPEPVSIVLLGLGGLAMVMPRRRRAT